jgi:hypothetical protein
VRFFIAPLLGHVDHSLRSNGVTANLVLAEVTVMVVADVSQLLSPLVGKVLKR